MTLYDIKEELLRLIQFAENEEVDEEAIKDTFEALEGLFEDKADGYAMVISELTADANKLDAEIKRLTGRKKVIESNIERIKKVLFDVMKAVKKEKFKTTKFSFSIANNGGVQPLKITGEVPKEFLTTPEPEADNAKIREYLKTNVCKWAHLEERGQSLRIK